jgi:tRNA pseudouridine38-40 synthase
MPRTISLRLAYQGTKYSGWQAQPGRATVQGTLAAAIRSISGEELLPRGASRTDAGVHAHDQRAAFTTNRDFPPDVWLRAINARLPDDIVVLQAEEVTPDFDPVVAAVRKRYRYRIHDTPPRPVFSRHFVWQWSGPLDVAAMQQGGEALVGRHDFTSFETASSPRIDKVRTIFDLVIVRCPGADGRPEGEVWIEVEGNGFLYNMVRIIVGTLVMVGCGRRRPDWVAEVLAARHRPAAGPTAPPQGLVLLAVFTT